MIHLAIVEDNAEIRSRLIEITGSDDELSLIGSYENAEDFLSEYQYLNHQVVFMDIHLPGKSGIEAITIAKQLKPQVDFIIYTIFEDAETVFEAIKAGATGYLLKSSTKERLIEAIFEIRRGESPMSGSIAMKVIKAFQQKFKAENQAVSQLSTRESEVLSYLTKGFRYKEIADKLFISQETVRTHIRNIYDKLQVRSKVEAINKINQSTIYNEAKYTHSTVKAEDESECFSKIQSLFTETKPFLIEKYSITQLAKQVGFPVYVVSQTINKRFKMGFFDLINHFRINETLTIMKSGSKNLSIEGIAYECGFCSRTTFYKAFKKETGSRPGNYIAGLSKAE